MSTTDLDALRSKREAKAKAGGHAPKVKFKGKTYHLPIELPFGVFTQLNNLEDDDEDAAEVLTALLENVLGDAKDEFIADGPTLEDIKALFEVLGEEYETEEAPAE